MLEYALHSLQLLQHQRMTLYAFDMQQQYYADMLPPSPPPIQVPSQQRPPTEQGHERLIPQPTPVQHMQQQQRQQQVPSSDHSPASSNSQSFSHTGSPMPFGFDHEAYNVPFLADWPNQTWPFEVTKHLPPSFSQQQVQQQPVQNSTNSIDNHPQPLTQSITHQNGFNPQQPSPFPVDQVNSLDSSDFATSLFLASPPNSVKSDDSHKHQSQGRPSPMVAHSPPVAPLVNNMALAFGVGDLIPTESVGIKREKELSPQASYDPRFLTSNPAPITEASPRQTFNGLFNPTDPPMPIQQDTSESSSLESSEEDPNGPCLEPVVPSQLHDTEHGSRLPRSPRLAPPIPVPNLTKKSRGRRVPTTSYVMEDGVSKDRPFACTVPGCGKCFARGEHLKRHVRSIHTNEKPHKCPVPSCGKEFSRNDNLCQHMRVHKGYSRYSDRY